MGLIAELLTFFVLWPEGLLIALAGATVGSMLAMVGTGIVMSLRRKEPTTVNKIND
jgi:hypothetical protein